MSAAVDSGRQEVRLNGHHETNGTMEEVFQPPTLRLDDPARALKIEKNLSGLMLSGAMVRHVAEVFSQEIERGLQGEPSSLQMENTYVPELCDGTEEGLFLSLDLGGTNFRVLLLELKDGEFVREDVKHYHISDELRVGPGEDLFNFLADCVQDFLVSEGMEHDELSLGFTFSFPMKHHSISSGELITWTKSFTCGGMAGADLAGLLQRCLLVRGLRVRVRVLLNDTTGTLVAGAHIDSSVGIAVILGTGSNGCYMERASRVHWETQHDDAEETVVVDVEWGAFGDNGCLDFLRTPYDEEVDRESLLTASFTFEKYIGGKYLGAIVRAVLASLAESNLFPAPPAHDSLTTAHLSLFEEEYLEGGWSRTAAVLSASCDVTVCEQDARVAQFVARCVSTRAALLASLCIATLLRRMGRVRSVGVAVDGSVYKRHPTIAALMQEYIAALAPECPFHMVCAEDGSGKGSALTAAIAARLARRHHLA